MTHDSRGMHLDEAVAPPAPPSPPRAEPPSVSSGGASVAHERCPANLRPLFVNADVIKDSETESLFASTWHETENSIPPDTTAFENGTDEASAVSASDDDDESTQRERPRPMRRRIILVAGPGLTGG
ncbi:MAG: hypothetical protein SGPRY_012202 [Prymnesium sp.]